MISQRRNVKKSNLSWLNQLPQNWDILPNRAIFKERNTRNTIDERLLSVTINKGVISQSSMIQRSSKKDSSNEDKSKYKLVLPGDIVYNKMRMWQGAVGYSNLRGIVSPAYIVLRSSKDIYPNYFHYLFRTPAYSKECHKYSHGICDDQMSLRFDDFKTIASLLPPIIEQQAIVRFLDCKSAQINKFTQKKKRLIELLKEQKQAIINQAVTRGLDPNVKLKPSGVEWLGDIPEHWEVRKIGQLCKFNPSKSEAASLLHKDGMIRFLAMENITTGGGLMDPPLKHISEVDSGFTYFKNGDVVIAKITPCFENGKGALIANLDSICGFGTTELIVLRPFQVIQGSFLYWITRNLVFRLIGEKFMIGAAGQKRVPSSFIKGYSIALPPLDEQNNIINHIQKVTDSINNCISRITKEIDLIQEYRTRLISDVVTGQLDVRNIEIVNIVEEELIEEAQEEEQEEESLELAGVGDDD